MDRLRQRLETARNALATFEVALKQEYSEFIRDASIQRFEYTLEAVWKSAQLYLRVREGIDVHSPKGVIRAVMRAGILDEKETRRALALVDDRNLSVHLYHEGLADSLYHRLGGYSDLLRTWLDRMMQ